MEKHNPDSENPSSKDLVRVIQFVETNPDATEDQVIEEFPDLKTEIKAFFETDADFKKITQANSKLFGNILDELTDLPNIDEFEVIRLVGTGGMGRVFEAIKTKTGQHVALKLIPKELNCNADVLAWFTRETKLAAEIFSSHIIPVFDVVECDGSPVLVMPFIEGCNLEQIILQRDAYKHGESCEGFHSWAMLSDERYEEKIVSAFGQIAEAMAALHKEEIIHRDIKPSNILIDERGNAWLSDFGLARLKEHSDLTQKDVIPGTLGFISPERFDNFESVNEQCDIFAFGVSFYRAITMDLPFGKSIIRRKQRLPKAPTKFTSHLNGDLDSLIFNAIHPNPDTRYRDSESVKSDIQCLNSSLPIKELQSRGRIIPILILSFVGIAALLLTVNSLLPKDTGEKDLGARDAGEKYPGKKDIGKKDIGKKVIGKKVIGKKEPGKKKFEMPDVSEKITVIVKVEPYSAILRGVMCRVEDDTGEFAEPIVMTARDGELIAEVALPGEYLVVVEIPDVGFHEVFRTVPDRSAPESTSPFRHLRWVKDGERIRLPKIKIVDPDSVLKGLEFVEVQGQQEFYPGNSRKNERPIQSYMMQKKEITIEQYEFICESMKVLRLQQSAGPISLDSGDPIVNVSYDQATEFAERIGARLPTRFEYEFAATNAGKTKYPWGDDNSKLDSTPFGWGEYKFDVNRFGIQGLYTRVGEWTSSRCSPPKSRGPFAKQLYERMRREQDADNKRVICGTSLKVLADDDTVDDLRGPSHWNNRSRSHAHKMLGFRCVKSKKPRFLKKK